MVFAADRSLGTWFKSTLLNIVGSERRVFSRIYLGVFSEVSHTWLESLTQIEQGYPKNGGGIVGFKTTLENTVGHGMDETL